MITKDKRKNKFLIILILISIILGISLLAPSIAPNDPYKTDLQNSLKAPSKEFFLGTDALGRCVFSRGVYGASRTIFSSLILVSLMFIFGSFIGIVSGYIGGLFDNIIMRIVDVFLAFPSLVLAIAIAGVLGGGMLNAMLAIGAIGWTKYARLARSEVLEIKEETFIKAARLSGNSSMYIIFKHIMPNVLSTLIVTASLDIGTTIMEMAALSFLGLSSPLPIPEWGAMMSEGKSMLQFAPWITIAPGVAIFIVVILFNLLGDAVHDMLDPKQKEY